MRLFLAFLLCLLFSVKADAISSSALKKYPYVLLTNDYGILNENDLGDFSWGFNRHPFSQKDIGGNYWQCFPRESIEIVLKDTGSSAAEVGWRDNIAILEITVWINPTLAHRFSMRALWSVVDFEKRFNKWRKIMNGEKYVCLAGDFVNHQHTKENGIEKNEYNWIFEKMKTKKGCDSYLYRCNPTYEAYLKEQKRRHISQKI